MTLCTCGSQKPYTDCCQPFVSGKAKPTTPEQLMRSRYTAYTQANVRYIRSTMRGPALNGFNAAHAKQWAKSVTWQKLQVLKASNTQVEFAAYYEANGTQKILHELSSFEYIDNQWFYVDGQTPAMCLSS